MFIYDENETMKRIGKVSCNAIDNDRRKMIFDVLNAHQKHSYGVVQLSIDIFLLGYLCGKGDFNAINGSEV